MEDLLVAGLKFGKALLSGVYHAIEFVIPEGIIL